MRNYNERKHYRHVKGMRRIKEDRAQHGNDRRCPCFSAQADKGKGPEFARFADTPTLCSGWCCGNQRKVSGDTMQERKAATVKDWQ